MADYGYQMPQTPAPPVPDLDPMAPPLPAGMVEATRDTQAITTPIIPPEFKAGVEQMDSLQTRDTSRGALEVINAERQRTLDAQKAQEELTAANARLAEQERANEETALKQAEREQTRKAEQMELRQLAEREANHKFETIYSRMSTGAKVLQGISLALGTFGASFNKSHNYALDIIQNAENGEFERQKAELEKLRNAKLDMRAGIQDNEALYEKGQTEVVGRSLGRIKAIENRLVAGLKRLGLDDAAIASDARILSVQKMYADREEERLKQKQDMLAKGIGSVTNTHIARTGEAPGSGPTGGDKKMALHGSEMDAALKQLETLPVPTQADMAAAQDKGLITQAADAAGEKSVIGGAVVGKLRDWKVLPRSSTSGAESSVQQFLQHSEVMVTNLAHLMTGAGMPAEEARKKAQTFAYSADDTPATFKQKIEGAKRLAASTLALSGNAAKLVPGQAAPAPPKAAPAAGDPAAAARLQLMIKNGTPEQQQRARALLQRLRGN